ncbi:NlpC/P60 family protein [Yoonia vestfoldensis]|uniref:Phage_NlpC_fam: putative phage cell wall peptidase, NlpC/P60 family n=1 Tax=Yoonia vestfoldensis TaxID=245188 RepID=A0A1Y0EBS0_9RHOB|nr:NlpC/P60 family protein [Yoonia vestfoldensis]ARU01013.1 phage_NlpC_fam: putative phage cell wall peptidase, NlpC/P60 family [Yoonia vestfoldensis]
MTPPVVLAARRWIGTPYLHQGAARGIGCDCLGLLRGLWRELHGAEPEQVPAYSPDWSEPQGQEYLWQAALRHMPLATGPLAAGDVLLFRMRAGGVAKHLGLVSATGAAPAFIHAYSGHGVVESPLSTPWARRIAARFLFAQRIT